MRPEESLSREEAVKVHIPLKEALFGDALFYRKVLSIVLPMIIQNTLTNVVSLLDNVMVGRVGTLQMSAVAIVNQLFFVFYLSIWGSLAGAGIYGTQYFGKKDYDGVRYTTRFKLLTAAAISVFTLTLFLIGGETFIGTYIAADTSPESAAATMQFAKQYLAIMMVGVIPFSLTQVYAGTLRESGQTFLPMTASMIAMVMNFVLNLVLIFGYLGFPRMGVAGAALATVISRFAEMGVIVFFSHRNREKYPFLAGLYYPFVIPPSITAPILTKIFPLFLNELMWSLAEAFLLQCYSVRGLAVVAAMNISNTISQIYNEVFLSLGSAAGILTGQQLGAGKLVTARRTGYRMCAVSVYSSIVLGALLCLAAPVIPRIYNTEESVRSLATAFLIIAGIVMPVRSIANAQYFIIRSGGRIFITFLFDSCFSWVAFVPAAFLLSHYTTLPVTTVYLLVLSLEFIKGLLGFYMMNKGSWVRNIISDITL